MRHHVGGGFEFFDIARMADVFGLFAVPRAFPNLDEPFCGIARDSLRAGSQDGGRFRFRGPFRQLLCKGHADTRYPDSGKLSRRVGTTRQKWIAKVGVPQPMRQAVAITARHSGLSRLCERLMRAKTLEAISDGSYFTVPVCLQTGQLQTLSC